MDGTVRILRELVAPSQDEGRGGEELAATDMTLAWLLFWSVLAALAILDVYCLAPASADGAEAMPAKQAYGHVLFWFTVGIVFNAGVFFVYGQYVAEVWFNGYILEYLLSMDNVFFFHVVFDAYSTPQSQVYKALFLGISIAVVLRLLFYVVGSEFFRLAFIVQIFFGLVLVYSGFKTAWSDEDDDDPRENRCVQWITRCVPLSDQYDSTGALFMRAPVESSRGPGAPASVIGIANGIDGAADETVELGMPPTTRASSKDTELRGTMLFLVVIVLGVIDVIFAVDSVTAKIAEYDSTFINFSSSAFAMLCLRSMYFVLTRLLKYFRLLKYGVALILCLIGVKLIISKWVVIDESYSLAAICGVFFISMVLSVVWPEADEYKEQADAQNDDGLDMYPLGDLSGLTAAEEDDGIDDLRVGKAGQGLEDDDLPMPDDFDDFEFG